MCWLLLSNCHCSHIIFRVFTHAEAEIEAKWKRSKIHAWKKGPIAGQLANCCVWRGSTSPSPSPIWRNLRQYGLQDVLISREPYFAAKMKRSAIILSSSFVTTVDASGLWKRDPASLFELPDHFPETLLHSTKGRLAMNRDSSNFSQWLLPLLQNTVIPHLMHIVGGPISYA